MTSALVTGSAGFLGRRVADALAREGHEVMTYELGDNSKALEENVNKADFIFHFAGVNRPIDPAEFEKVNAGLTEDLCRLVADAGNRAVVVLASSAQAVLDNPYGVSKRRAELALEQLAANGGRAVVFRLPNVFGPGCRPNYNSVVATFAHNSAHGLPIEIHEPERELALVYVHDVARTMVEVAKKLHPPGSIQYAEVSPIARTTLQSLADKFSGFRSSREDARIPTVSDGFERKLYATYLSYLKPDNFAYPLSMKSDDRGVLAEFLKGERVGQLFLSRTRPGAQRGHHYHHTKTEKFLVVEGDGLIRFRRADGSGDVVEYQVKGSEFRVVDIPPDYTHSIENTGTGELVVLFWASEVFDPNSPDTFALKV